MRSGLACRPELQVCQAGGGGQGWPQQGGEEAGPREGPGARKLPGKGEGGLWGRDCCWGCAWAGSRDATQDRVPGGREAMAGAWPPGRGYGRGGASYVVGAKLPPMGRGGVSGAGPSVGGALPRPLPSPTAFRPTAE